MSRPPARSRQLFDISFFVFVALAIGGGAAVLFLKGQGVFFATLEKDLGLFLRIAPQVAGGMLVGGFISVLIPNDVVARWLGRESGFRGILIASIAGIVTPGGPIISFPVVLALATAGADIGALLAYLTAWSTLGLTRIIVWEIPFMGVDFTLVRFVASIPLPFIAGYLVRRLPPVKFRDLVSPMDDTP
ncbi:MAG: permease [Proteobacteria bacterium]|nr:permease [Pseudomonadota bacterium]MDA1059243.1 permease [Pseudomonadota bacterium]